jgi:ADP-heptose:LPS heptosyltransferase
MFFRMAGVRRIVGIADEQEMKFRFDEAAGLYEREPFRLARLIAELGDAEPANLANWDLMLSEGERETAREAVRTLGDGPLIVCGPGTKMPAKDWGPDNWQTLLGRIDAKYPGHSLVLVGAKEEFGVAEHAARQWRGPWVNLCGNLAPRETAALLERARIFLGPDSGPMHLAASKGVPCVIAFSAASPPGIWFPYGNKHQIVYHRPRCAGCYLEKCNVQGHPCLTSISVEEMETAVDRAMHEQDGIRPVTVLS